MPVKTIKYRAWFKKTTGFFHIQMEYFIQRKYMWAYISERARVYVSVLVF